MVWGMIMVIGTCYEMFGVAKGIVKSPIGLLTGSSYILSLAWPMVEIMAASSGWGFLMNDSAKMIVNQIFCSSTIANWLPASVEFCSFNLKDTKDDTYWKSAAAMFPWL